jgi:tetratricopeptide (TPR) repeat protein
MLLTAFLTTFSAAFFTAASLPAQTAAPVEAELEKGRQLLQQHEYFAALQQYQRANRLAGGTSADAFLGMAQAAQGMKTYKNALDFAQSAVERASGNSRLIARAYRLRGQVYLDIKDPTHAEEAFRAALVADPDSNVPDLHYGLALALLAQRRDEEAIAELKKEIDIRPHGTTAEDAAALIANPRRGREKYAPGFSLVAADGRTISLDTLRGKVVLLDFWASGSGASVRAVPAIKKLLKDHAGAPLAVVSISEDDDPRAWSAFTEKYAMTWAQCLDERGRLAHLFDVQTVPTYVLLDGEGIERLRVQGMPLGDARALEAELDAQLKLAAAPK